MTVAVYCTISNHPIADNELPLIWRRVVGWERNASRAGVRRGGGSDIALRETREEYACDDCVQKHKLGITPTQGTLGGMDDAA